MTAPRSGAARPRKVRRYGLIGWPLQHSLSPAIHSAAFAAAGLDASYELFPVRAEALAAWVADARHDVAGFNVTIPHKVAIVGLVDVLGAEAAAVGAVNTVACEAGRLTGHNTDTEGFAALLAALGPPSGCPALLLGTGGAARAAALVLTRNGHTLEVAARRAPGAELDRLAEAIVPWNAATLAAAGARATLLVNATPLGAGDTEDPWPPEPPLPPYVADLVPLPSTPLVRRARAQGARAEAGLPMLVAQAAASFAIWTGCAAPAPAMRRAAGLAPELDTGDD